MIDPDVDDGTSALLLTVTPGPAVAATRLVIALSVQLGGSARGDATLVDPSGVAVAYRRDRVLALALARGDVLLTPDVDPPGPQGTRPTLRLAVPIVADEPTTLVLAFADAEAARGRTPTLVGGAVDVHDRVGLRVLRALQEPGGGVLAAPECDPDMRRSGGYGFVWARDLAFIITAAVARQRDIVDGALDWLVRAQSPDGLYEQRHWSDGRVAPSWGLQLDEAGAVLHAIGEVARILDDSTIVERCWPTVVRGADALAGLLDPLTGLPPASLDAWEERVGVHTYTVAATIAGLEAAAAMADARDVAREDAAGAPVPPRHQPEGRPVHPVRSVDPVDGTVDASLLGLAYPFAVLAQDDARLVATIDAVASALEVGPGLLRYPGDTYVGGNPWLLTRLWLGLARRAPGAAVVADGLDAVASCATDAGLLAEQVDAVTGRPVWVVPLAWSHAFLALACRPDHRPGAVGGPGA